MEDKRKEWARMADCDEVRERMRQDLDQRNKGLDEEEKTVFFFTSLLSVGEIMEWMNEYCWNLDNLVGDRRYVMTIDREKKEVADGKISDVEAFTDKLRSALLRAWMWAEHNKIWEAEQWR